MSYKRYQSDEYDPDLEVEDLEESSLDYRELNFDHSEGIRSYEPELEVSLGEAVDQAVALDELLEAEEALDTELEEDKELTELINRFLASLNTTTVN